MLAISVLHAIRDAVASACRRTGPRRTLDAPATPEEVLRAVTELKARTAAAGQRQAAA